MLNLPQACRNLGTGGTFRTIGTKESLYLLYI